MPIKMRAFLVLYVGLAIEAQGLNMMDAYSSVIRYSDLLHGSLQEAAREVSKFDVDGAKAIEDFEYNWLSLMGIYKGIFPIVSDFFMNYYSSADFMNSASGLTQSLVGVFESFRDKADIDILCKRLKDLTETVVKSSLFQDGPIKSFLQDVRELEANEESFKVIVRTLQKRGSEVQELLYFIITGRIVRRESGPNSEL